jgi:type II secretory pathway pseudopilin PulG
MASRNRSAGFVLIDALVAFAIAALALTVILSVLPSTAVQQGERLNRHLAMEFAFSTLEENRVTYPQMRADGEDPSGWSWSIVETDLPAEVDPAAPLIKYVEVNVSAWHRDRPDLRATLQAKIARRSE